MQNKILVIIGPTAIGKSQYAIKKALELNAEIISADAFQVYKDMDIGTAKASKKDISLVPHHLIDLKTPKEKYSVAEFMEKTKDILQKRKDKNTIICGGTAFYIRAFLYDYKFPQNSASSESIRKELEEKENILGIDALWQELLEIDPKAHEFHHKNNKKRIIRALEIFYSSGSKPSEFRYQLDAPKRDADIIGLIAPREIIYEKINARVLNMIKRGLIDEVKMLLNKYPEDCPAFEALGYKESIEYLKGRIALEEMIELLQQKTRNYAKQQLTWYRKFKHVKWIEVQ